MITTHIKSAGEEKKPALRNEFRWGLSTFITSHIVGLSTLGTLYELYTTNRAISESTVGTIVCS